MGLVKGLEQSRVLGLIARESFVVFHFIYYLEPKYNPRLLKMGEKKILQYFSILLFQDKMKTIAVQLEIKCDEEFQRR